MKRCTKCGEVKPLADFYTARGTRDGRRGDCKACHSVRAKAWYALNREASIANVQRWQRANRARVSEYRRQYRARRSREMRDQHLRRTFGISLEDYDRLLAAQSDGCAICGARPAAGRSLHVDHDHDTGVVRGLLCFRCNGGLGQFAEDPGRLAVAVDYVQSAGFAWSGAHDLTELARDRAASARKGPV